MDSCKPLYQADPHQMAVLCQANGTIDDQRSEDYQSIGTGLRLSIDKLSLVMNDEVECSANDTATRLVELATAG